MEDQEEVESTAMSLQFPLCAHCRVMISFIGKECKDMYHHIGPALFESSKNGCPLCTLMCELFEFRDTAKLLPVHPEQHREAEVISYDIINPLAIWFKIKDTLRDDNMHLRIRSLMVIKFEPVQGSKSCHPNRSFSLYSAISIFTLSISCLPRMLCAGVLVELTAYY